MKGKQMGKQIANIITGCRILGSIWMLLTPAGSVPFCTAYLLCGLSDMIDGTVARRTNCVSEFGAGFDTAADFGFVAVSLFKLLPLVQVPKWLWVWMAVIAGIKIVNLASGLIHRKRFLWLHTGLNQITGLLLFLLPFTLPFLDTVYSFSVVCALATVSAIHEGDCIIAGYGNDECSLWSRFKSARSNRRDMKKPDL